MPSNCLEALDRIVYICHPFVHFKDLDHEYGLGVRTIKERTHAAHLLEADAKEAIKLMYIVCKATLREAV